MFQAALTSLEQEAKDNVYAVLDPHIQYDITISKHGEPPKYLSLSKPISHQRTHEFDPQYVRNNEINNNCKDVNENRFTTFKGPVKSNIRKSNRSNNQRNSKINEQRNICKTNNDIEYTADPYFGINVGTNNFDTLFSLDRDDQQRSSKSYTRMYERNNSGRSDKLNRKPVIDSTNVRKDGNRNKKIDLNINANKKAIKIDQDVKRNEDKYDGTEDYKPRPGKVREIASRFNQYSGNLRNSFRKSKIRPKPIQIGNQAYLDHVFPDAVEI